MTRVRMALAALLAAAILTGAAASAASAVVEPGFPTQTAALGDSITQAFQTCGAFANCPKNSWSTGTTKTVDSVLVRIKAHNSLAKGHNYSVTGAKVAGLHEQATKAVKAKVKAEFVTVLIGANDACASPPTSTSSFTTSFEAAIDTLKSGLPGARIFVGSIPNLMHLWELLHTNPEAVKKWETFPLCPGIMTHPTSMAPEDVARREATLNAEIGYDAAMQSICSADPQCQFDGDAVFHAAFTEAEVSTVDYFHPNVSGQASLAALAWSLLSF
jgi:lysophospholipase L1-like esterase